MTMQLSKEQVAIMAKHAAEIHYNSLKAPGWSSFEKHWQSNPEIATIWGVIVAGIVTAAGQAFAINEAATAHARDAINPKPHALPAEMLIRQGEEAAGAVREPFRGTEPHPGLRRAIPGALAPLDPAQRADNVRTLLAEFDTLTKVRDQVAHDIERGHQVYWVGAFYWATVARTGKVSKVGGDLNERDGYNEHAELDDGTKFRVTPLIIAPGFFRAHFEGNNHEWVPFNPPCLEPGAPARAQFKQT